MNLENVIVVDDDPLFLGVTDALLRSLGAGKVSCFTDANEALSELKRTSDDIDLILSDVNMPGIDGISFIRTLAERKFRGSLIIASAEAEAVIKSVESLAKMIGINILGGLKKPLRQPALKALLDTAKADALSAADEIMDEKEVREALTGGHVVPVYQPQLNLSKMRFDGIEVLCRLRGVNQRLGPPGSLLAAAENYGLMNPLTFYLLRRSLSELKPWLLESPDHICSLNISPLTLKDRSMPRILTDSVRRMGIETRQVTLEVTENHILAFGPDTLEVLARLRIAGFGLSIDDFGTGATSHEQLKRFPFTELKIDRAYVQDTQSDAFAREVLMTSARLARIVGLTSVAEGIETRADLEQVVAAGVNHAQGFLLARPMTAENLTQWREAPPSEQLKVA